MRRKLWLLAALLAVFTSCAGPPAADTPAPSEAISDGPSERSSGAPSDAPAFTTYDEATEYVREHYQGESIDTGRSSWITSAEYYPADGHGYLILGMKGHDYIFAGVPEDVWEGFKEAPSLGHYYNAEIRGRYHFDLEAGSDAQGEDEADDDE